MSKLAGYRTILVSLMTLAVGVLGLHISPEFVQRHVDYLLYGITALNMFMRTVSTGPVGQLLPQLAIVEGWRKRLAAMIEVLPAISIQTAPVDAQPAPETSSIVPAPAPPGQDDIAALLPIYAASIMKGAETLSETSKAN